MEKNFKEISNVFFEALEYPEYARTHFYINKQKESGWDRGIYFTALNDVYHNCIQILEMYFNARKRKHDNLNIEEITLTIHELIGINNNTKITKDILDDLFYSIQRVNNFDKKEIVYDSIQVVSFAEVAILFIRDEFYEQTKKYVDTGFRPRTDTFFIYYISQDAPFFDFPKFKNAVRNLIYSSQNPKKIENLLISFHKIAVELVKIWNEELFFIEQNSNTNNIEQKNEVVRVEFKAETLSKSWWSDDKLYDNCKPYKVYLNQDLAFFSAKIANLINSEIIHRGETKLEIVKKNFLNDFLRGFHTLLELGSAEMPIDNILQGKYLESPFRDYFYKWFTNLNYYSERESLYGSNFIDLKIIKSSIEKDVIEFKGWWNSGKKSLILQIFNYLSQFDGVGYIFMINHLKKNIEKEYQNLITKEANGYIKNTWKVLKYKHTGFTYFRSEHILDGKKKAIYHFIFNIPYLRQVHKKNSANKALAKFGRTVKC